MKHGFATKIEQTLDHQRGAIGVYDTVYMILLPLVAIIGGACSISSMFLVWIGLPEKVQFLGNNLLGRTT
jgi:hypothetical protein